jgi:uncharacterized beta-barrel protein YwiB (DUF1934 family)
MADQKVLVRETSSITCSDGDVTDLSSLSPGCLRDCADGLLLTYTDDTEGGKVFNRVEISGERVSVRRTGAVSLSLTFEAGKTEHTVYGVPPFSFDMTVSTESVRVRREENGGLRIGLVFRSVVGGAPQTTHLNIRATPKGEA